MPMIAKQDILNACRRGADIGDLQINGDCRSVHIVVVLFFARWKRSAQGGSRYESKPEVGLPTERCEDAGNPSQEECDDEYQGADNTLVVVEPLGNWIEQAVCLRLCDIASISSNG